MNNKQRRHEERKHRDQIASLEFQYRSLVGQKPVRPGWGSASVYVTQLQRAVARQRREANSVLHGKSVHRLILDESSTYDNLRASAAIMAAAFAPLRALPGPPAAVHDHVADFLRYSVRLHAGNSLPLPLISKDDREHESR